MSFWDGKTVLVTGGSGFLGAHVLAALASRGVDRVLAPRSAEYDLRDHQQVRAVLRWAKPDIVIHLAAVVGGIGANMAEPGRFFHDNAVMGIHLIEEARLAGVERFICVGTVCAYPKFTPVPFREDALWNGYPEETNAPYGLAKKALLVQLQAYRRQYGFDGIYLLPCNLYGPGDNFDPERSHVIPAMIRRFMEAVDSGASTVTLWGSGRATREFLYVEDCAEGILVASERYCGDEPLNLGTGEEVSIADLAEAVADVVGYRGSIRWDTSRPDGQPRRRLDVSKAQAALGFRALTPFREGLARTVEWYRSAVSLPTSLT